MQMSSHKVQNVRVSRVIAVGGTSVYFREGVVKRPTKSELLTNEVDPTGTASKVETVVTTWVKDGFCRLDEILILSPHGTKAKTSLANYSTIGEWPVGGIDDRKPGNLTLLSVNKAKGLDSLAVIMIDVERFDKPATPQEKMNYFMGASRARQLLAIIHKSS
jgi:hypothetical protein